MLKTNKFLRIYTYLRWITITKEFRSLCLSRLPNITLRMHVEEVRRKMYDGWKTLLGQTGSIYTPLYPWTGYRQQHLQLILGASSLAPMPTP